MRNLSDTIARLSFFRGLDTNPMGNHPDRLSDMVGFGSNPGALRARVYVPDDLPASAPLVVVLHGCTQSSAAYDHGSGWSALADEQGFAVLYPEQQRANNGNLCFNWFVSEDIQRDGGEALSIRQMVAGMIAAHDLDPARVFVTGLSAGGAMAAVMLATYPDVFASGAVIAGIPYGSATSMAGAFDRMRGSGAPGATQLGSLVRDASTHEGPWPTLSVWHGSADHTVDQANAGLLIDQWRTLHDLPLEPTLVETIDGHPRRTWRDAEGRVVIEDFRIDRMGHGTPLDPEGATGGGVSGPYMLDVGIFSTRHIAAFWGLGDAPARTVKSALPVSKTVKAKLVPLAKPVRASVLPKPPAVSAVAKVIDDALRSAGLLR
ncbi:PHB depolymerase family esterase [Sphingomonas sp.]|uniref:extracellular catalytic domain type 1 short-chain-length polyhydroxyalkanoate depolymerase n=1 Tax=Sphingomonas sp. TaxID=28214 RepID=UPI0025FE0750|nr:PHB depolymerase family esterase [Sphingomonas sp.]